MPQGRDQNENAARVTAHGAGLALTPSASVDDIAAAVRQLLSDPRFGLAAERLGNAILKESFQEPAVGELEVIAGAARTSQRTNISCLEKQQS
jgi:UDP:flavonoid glycosyltransferase YjiC (YdhE family)